jgi:hypothetical protein
MPIDQEGNEYDQHATQGRDPVKWRGQQGDSLKMLGWAFGLAIILLILESFRQLVTR